MKVLVIGNGGREHCLAWKISQSKRVSKIYFTGSNAGMEEIAAPVDIKISGKFDEAVDFIKKEGIDLVVVGPEIPLAEGITDVLEKKKIAVFGPSKNAAKLEWSKSFAKKIMQDGGIPTAKSEIFKDANKAKSFLKKLSPPYVIKADGLAAGKGVIIAETIEEAEKSIKQIMVDKVFGEAGESVLVEEYLKGEEASMLAFIDGETILPMISAQDHKRIYDGDKGPNTGGMGSYSPCPIITTAAAKNIHSKIFQPLIKALKKNNILYKGVIYAGLMIQGDSPKVLEFNCRFGDPETQSVLPLLKNDIIDLFEAVIQGKLKNEKLRWRKGSAVCVIMSSGGYPNNYKKGYEIKGLEQINNEEDVHVFHAGTKKENGKILTNGGRVLGVTTVAATLPEALHKNYKFIKRINFEGCHFRTDIGRKGLNFRRTIK